ncbi:PL29 family lyase N-terminal domain-containing protein [Segatella copri]|uniref:PL29 family lyase N-terminal domain-containing protein n=1 Tax=Segatella copri TaxID=165179 RepID=UPI00294B4893|nr:PL29 family lyase N-terminal domain-containing protein [Segatella copri]WOG31419.1 PL29 family lyase N-terminal domain-containing protein [Segatella copri]
MKRKYFSALLMGALTIASVSTFTSCKDYDDDISNLQQQIDSNAKAIETIQNLIKGGGLVKGVTSNNDGITVTLSDGNTVTISNGKDGAPGTAWTIGTDGYWYKDGTKTENLARGPQGEKGEQGERGEQGVKGEPGTSASVASYEYYVPNAESGYFDIYKDGKKVKQSNVKFVSETPNSITASLDKQNLILTGVKGISGEKVVISLSGDLTGLVFMPNLYLDGIETLTYDYLHGEYLGHKENLTGVSRLTTTGGAHKTITGLDNYLPDRLNNSSAVAPAAATLYNYGPAWGVKYHMNPSNADMAYEDITGFNLLEPTILNYHTRATASVLGNITSPELNDAGKALFNTSNGIVTAGLKIQHPEKLEPFPTVKDKNETANTIALQAKTAASTVAEGKVTSDYALIQPQKAYLEALYWRLKPHYAGLGLPNTRKGDETGIPVDKYFGTTAADVTEKVHVYDSPQEALADPDGAALELYYNSAEGIDIASYLGLHMLVEDVKQFTPGTTTTPNKLGVNLKEMSLEEGKEWGLTYQFNLVEYKVDGNATIDSRYAKWVNQDAGILRAWNVDASGNPSSESATSIDREPLVQVLVKRGDKVVLDGYILIHITRQNPEVAPNKTIDLLTKDAKFDLCNDIADLKTEWAQFSATVLTEGLENMTKKDFDEQYTIDAKGNFGSDAAGNTTKDLKMFKAAPEKGGTYDAADDLGHIEYFANTEGTTNHAFKWHLAAEDLEKLTHDQANPVPVVRYVRYIGNAKAKYPYIYIKLTYNLSRINKNQTFGELIPEYWKGLDGSVNGKDAVIFDVKEPTNGGDILGISRKVTSTLKGNVAKLVGTHKYYFVPEPVVVGGYTITPQSSAADTKWNKLFCKYITGDSHVFSKAKLQETLEGCAIKYADGAFTNEDLYAVKGTSYVKIATLDPATSEITLVKNETTKAVLNAIGYEPANANIQKELRSWVGVVTENSCGVAEYVKDGIFLTSWERPINLIDVATEPRIDANTNGNVIYALDLFKLYDWRGWNTATVSEAGCVANQSNMWGDHLWFWGYYNVKSITIDTTPAKVKTTLGGGSWTTMDQISNQVELKCGNVSGNAADPKTKGKVTYTNDLTSYNSASQNAALTTFMEANKAKFGTIWYYNNGGNVETFKVKVPITIAYEWGEFTTEVEFTIKGTIGD